MAIRDIICSGTFVACELSVKDSSFMTSSPLIAGNRLGLYSILGSSTHEATPPVKTRATQKILVRQAVTDIVESVALQQAALASVLNAEGKKIQRIVSMNALISDMLLINDSVKGMVRAVTKLEFILYLKLKKLEKKFEV